ncbi:UNKNOWN [Stylonychia lemnae]|uniref:Ion transport domain-containing protein n=1 Tax=Stylonychia lemnae TaxID=5949 RepID=A0A078A133_STYLE|nr:UNKNOWN [Stylonychia lemnae]|eukprot:CDW75193.1 UNKNOWN [Stylonychia lemnae]
MAFRISSGDFQLDDFHSQGNGLVILTWLIWLIAVMTLYIVFMNFIIAVISESYERVMQKLIAESYRVKANLTVEREQFFSSEDLKSTKYFPQYIVVRRPLNAVIKEDGEWQGFIKDLKYTIRTTVAKSKADIIQNLHQLQTQNNQKLDKIDEVLALHQKQFTNDGLDEKIKILSEKHDQVCESSKKDLQILKTDLDELAIGLELQNKDFNIKVDGLDKQAKGLDIKVAKIQDDIEFIKNSLTQLLPKYNQ